MVEIKNTISFDEYNAIIDKVVNDCFPNDIYSPAYYEISLRTALLCAFASNYEINDTDNNTLWDSVTNGDANNILYEIRQNRMYPYIEEAIENAINYRIKMITSSPMSMADMALATLFDTINEKVSQIDMTIPTKDNIETIMQAVNATKDNQFAESLVNTMLDKGIIRKSSERVEG